MEIIGNPTLRFSPILVGMLSIEEPVAHERLEMKACDLCPMVIPEYSHNNHDLAYHYSISS